MPLLRDTRVGAYVIVSPLGAGGMGGRELIYLSADRTLFSLPIRTTPSLVLGTPTPLFRLKAGTTWGDFDVSRDGNRFLSVVSEVRVSGQPVILVLNGIAEPAR